MTGLRAEFAAQTDTGRVRPNNEDAWAADPELGLYLVSDGMGGCAAGEVASAMVCERVPSFIKDRLLPAMSEKETERVLEDALKEASREVREDGARKIEHAGLGATAVLVLFREDVLTAANVGDSRAYLFRGGKLFLLTKDHSGAQELIDAGKLDRRFVRGHPGRFQLTQCMGMTEEVSPGIHTMKLTAGDRILLSSDGLTDMIDEEDIERLLGKAVNPEDACRRLVRAANEAGGSDNITTLVLFISES